MAKQNPKVYIGIAFGVAAIPFIVTIILLVVIIFLRLKNKKKYESLANKSYGVSDAASAENV